MHISGSDVTFEGFKVNGNAVCAVLVSGDNCNILNNDIEETPLGLTLYSSAGTTVARNTISGHRVGIYIDDSVDCAVYLNDFENIVNGKSVSRSIRWSTNDLVYGYEGNSFTSTLGNFWNDYYFPCSLQAQGRAMRVRLSLLSQFRQSPAPVCCRSLRRL